MKHVKLQLLGLLLTFLFSNQLSAQDIHFSHIHASPTLLNPAMTGLFDGDFRFIANYKSQWNGVTKGYQTLAGSVDMQAFNINKTTSIGAGLILATDKAGDLNFKTNMVNLDLSVIKQLDGRGRNMISLGVQNAFMSNSLDYSKIVAFDSEPDVLNGAPSKINYWDISAGLGWFYAIDRYKSFYLGTALSHINQPKVSFLDRESNENATRLYRKIVLHGGADFEFDRYFTLKPTFIFVDQGPHREINLGSYVKYKMKRNGLGRRSKKTSMYLGAWIRWYLEKDIAGADAIVLSARMDYNDFIFTFSYDLNISSWKRVSYGRGGPEFSIVKTLDIDRVPRKRHRVMCPVKF